MCKALISPAKLSKLLMDFQETRLQNLPLEYPVKYEFSKDFENRMEKLIRRERKPYYPLIKTRVRTAILLVSLILLFLVTTAFAIEPIRNKIFGFFLDVFDEFSIVSADYNDEKMAPTSIIDKYEPTYIPEGYFFFAEDKSNEFITTYYLRESPFDEISLTQSIKKGFAPMIDTEGVATTAIKLSNGMKGLYCRNKGVNIMVLHNDYYAFMISSQGNLDELIEFAESLITKK